MDLRKQYEDETGDLAFDKYFSTDPACTLPPTPCEEYVIWLETKLTAALSAPAGVEEPGKGIQHNVNGDI